MSSINIHDSLGGENAPIRLLYINPNSSLHFTKETVDYLKSRVPSEVRIDFYTAPSTAPASIDGVHDGILSTAVILQDLGLTARDVKDRNPYISQTYSAVIVACFSAHPLQPALRECLPAVPTQPPVLGIFDSAVNAALQVARTFGIATTGRQWEPLFVEHLRTLGIADSRISGVRGTGFDALSLHGNNAETALLGAALHLVEQGAEAIVLGCAVSFLKCRRPLTDYLPLAGYGSNDRRYGNCDPRKGQQTYPRY